MSISLFFSLHLDEESDNRLSARNLGYSLSKLFTSNFFVNDEFILMLIEISWHK